MFGRKREPGDFRSEIAAHIQLEAERLREQGLSEEDAGAAARRSFGNVMQTEERFHEAKRWLSWDQLWQDVRYGLRMLAKHPGFTGIAGRRLALGIGVTTEMFRVSEAGLLRLLAYRSAEDQVSVVGM